MTTATVAQIDHIIVKKGGAVNQLDGNSKLSSALVEASAGLACDGQAERTKVLAAHVEKVVGGAFDATFTDGQGAHLLLEGAEFILHPHPQLLEPPG
jgi:hypothetical protein